MGIVELAELGGLHHGWLEGKLQCVGDGCKWIGRVGALRRPDAAARRPYLPSPTHYGKLRIAVD